MKMATLERIYTINLRREFIKAPRYKKASKAIRAIKEFLKRHMKSDNIVIGKYLNQEIWKNGPKNPPHKVHIKVVKEEDKVKAELVGAPEEPKEKKETKKPKKQETKKEEKLEEKVTKEDTKETKKKSSTKKESKTKEKPKQEVKEKKEENKN
jgi:large subunit ribosomal protein L31e